MASRPRRKDETFEQYRENLFIEEETARHLAGHPVSRHQINKLRDINQRRHTENAALKKEVESR